MDAVVVARSDESTNYVPYTLRLNDTGRELELRSAPRFLAIGERVEVKVDSAGVVEPRLAEHATSIWAVVYGWLGLLGVTAMAVGGLAAVQTGAG